MKKVEVKMNKQIYLGQAILDISKTLMYEFWYDYIKPKYKDKAWLCYMDTNSLVINIRTKGDHHRVYTEEVIKISLSSNDDKRIQTYDKITTSPYVTNIFKICENKMLLKKKIKKLSIKMEKKLMKIYS